MPADNAESGFGVERRLAGDHLEKGRAQRIHVRMEVNFFAFGLFRADIIRRADHHAALSKLLFINAVDFRNTEVEQFDLAFTGQHDI